MSRFLLAPARFAALGLALVACSPPAAPPPEPPTSEPAAASPATEAGGRRFEGVAADPVLCRAATALVDLDPLLLRLAEVDDDTRLRAADALDEALGAAAELDGWVDLESVARRSRAVTEAVDDGELADAVRARGEPETVAAMERLEAACG